jgi:hypothetical protein
VRRPAISDARSSDHGPGYWAVANARVLKQLCTRSCHDAFVATHAS